jgi:hypothetical protein
MPMRDMVVRENCDDDEEEEDTLPLDLDGTDTNFDKLVTALAAVEPTAARKHQEHNPGVTPRQCGCVGALGIIAGRVLGLFRALFLATGIYLLSLYLGGRSWDEQWKRVRVVHAAAKAA